MSDTRLFQKEFLATYNPSATYGYAAKESGNAAKEADNMKTITKMCPECGKQIHKDEMYFVAVDEENDYGETDREFFAFHPECWARGECLGQLKAHTNWLIGLAASTLNTLRTQYDPPDVPQYAADYMPELDQALAGLVDEVNLLRSVAKEFQER